MEATARCFFELLRIGNYTTEELKVGFEYIRDYQIKHTQAIGNFGLKHRNLKEESKKYVQKSSSGLDENIVQANRERLKLTFCTFTQSLSIFYFTIHFAN